MSTSPLPCVKRAVADDAVPASHEGWAGKALGYRLLLTVLLWLAYSGLVATAIRCAHVRGKFENVTSSPPLLQVVPVQFVIMIHALVLLMQFLFAAYSSVATLHQLQVTQTPLPVLPLYVVVLLSDSFQIFALDSDALIASSLLNLVSFLTLVYCIVLILKKRWRTQSRIFYLFVVNPLAAFSSLLYLTLLYNITAFLYSKTSLDYDIVKTSMAIILLGSVVILVPFDLFFLHKYTRRLLGYYFPLLGATTAVNVIHLDFREDFDRVVFATGLVVFLAFCVKVYRYLVFPRRESRAGTRERTEYLDDTVRPDTGVGTANVDNETGVVGNRARAHENKTLEGEHCTRL